MIQARGGALHSHAVVVQDQDTLARCPREACLGERPAVHAPDGRPRPHLIGQEGVEEVHPENARRCERAPQRLPELADGRLVLAPAGELHVHDHRCAPMNLLHELRRPRPGPFGREGWSGVEVGPLLPDGFDLDGVRSWRARQQRVEVEAGRGRVRGCRQDPPRPVGRRHRGEVDRTSVPVDESDLLLEETRQHLFAESEPGRTPQWLPRVAQLKGGGEGGVVVGARSPPVDDGLAKLDAVEVRIPRQQIPEISLPPGDERRHLDRQEVLDVDPRWVVVAA